MDYTLIRSSRRTLAVEVTPQAEVVVRAPHRLPRREIERFLQQKQDWLEQHISRQRWRMEQVKNISLTAGTVIPLLGRDIVIGETEGKRAELTGDRFLIPAAFSAESAKNVLIEMYRQTARREMPERVVYYARLMGVKPERVSITSAKTRWGSCSGLNRISFSWRLMMAPAELVDYVAVHELAHLKQRNHKPVFWQLVGETLPDYRQRETALKGVPYHPIYMYLT